MFQLMFAHWSFGLIAFILGIAGIGMAVWILGEFEGNDKKLVVIPLILTGIATWGFFHQQTHFIVKPNESAIVISRVTGSQINSVQFAGIAKRPLWSAVVYKYPAQKNYQWCPTMTPSIENGVGIIADICFTFDASTVDWASEYLRYNGDINVVLNGWQNELQPWVAVAFSQYTAMELTNQRSSVMNSVTFQTHDWFVSHDIYILSIGLRTWDFTSAEMSAAWDQTQLSSTKITIAENDKKAAQIQADVATIRAQTCKNAGMITESGCLEYLQLMWLNGLPETPNNLVISLGGTAPAIAFPAAP